MTTLQKKMNQLSDADWGWWPLLGLRPKKETPMSSALVLGLTLTFGSVAAVVILAVCLLRHGSLSTEAISMCVPLTWLFYFVIYRITFARAWNVRAEELKDQK